MAVPVIILTLFMALVIFNLLYIKVSIRSELILNQQEQYFKLVVDPVWRKFRYENEIFIPHDVNAWTGLWPSNKKKKRETGRFKHGPVSEYYRLFLSGMRHLVVQKLNWKTVVGLDDIMYTAVACGGIWALKGSVAGMLGNICQLRQLNLAVEPAYNHYSISSRADCIFKMRIVYIMLIASRILIIILRGYYHGVTAGKAEPSYRRPDENRHGSYKANG